MAVDAAQRANLSGLVDRFLRIRLDFVAGVVGDFGNGLLEDGRRLSHWERRVQVGFALENTRIGREALEGRTQQCKVTEQRASGHMVTNCT